MRLTNVAQLRLPFGRLFGYKVAASEPGRTLPISFDQERHVGVGDRPGSWMAISFRLRRVVDRDLMARAWDAVVARHGTLRSVFVEGADGLELREFEAGPGAWEEYEVAPGEALNDTLRAALDRVCTPLSRPSHELCVLETAAGPTVILAADHSHVDMWSLLVLARDFLTALHALEAGREPDLPPAPPFALHTQALLERPPADDDLRARWREVIEASGGTMPTFPLPLGPSEPQPERVEVRDVFDVDDGLLFSAQARGSGVSTLSLAVSAMTEVTRELAGVPLRALFPVHSRFDPSWHDSAGWFITNSVLEVRDPDPKACAAAVTEAIRLGSATLRDVLAPWGGMPEAPGMFAISWLDLRRLPVRIDSAALEAQYVSASIRTDGVMLWFIFDDSGLHLRCRYPDTPEAREHVGGWLDGVVRRLQEGARLSVRSVLRVGDRRYRLERASRVDIPGIVALLADDELGRQREAAEISRYEAAFDTLALDRSQHLTVVRDEEGRIVATMQLTLIPGLSRGGATRLQLEGLRVAAHERDHGLGTAMLTWAHDYGRARGARLAQVATDTVRERARAFYTRLGYASDHVGLKREL